jgi:hypothetical protein
MKKYPVVASKHRITPRKRALEKTKTRILEAQDAAVLPARFSGQSFLSFHYSYTEITAEGGTARVKSHRAQYEDGKLQSERFEGEIERGEYERTVAEAQRHFAEQTATLLRSVFSLFPLLGKVRSGD